MSAFASVDFIGRWADGVTPRNIPGFTQCSGSYGTQLPWLSPTVTCPVGLTHPVRCAQAFRIVLDMTAVFRHLHDAAMVPGDLLEPPAAGMHGRAERKVKIPLGIRLKIERER